MPLTLTAGRDTDAEQVPDTHDDAHWLGKLDAALADFRATGDAAGRAIRFLSGLLDRHTALPLDAEAEAHELARRFLQYRYGPAGLHQRSVRDVVAEGWGKAVQCRLAYRQLSHEGRAMAVARWGKFTDGEVSDRPLWVLCFPQAALDALDVRAKSVGIGRGVPRLVGREGE